MGDESGVPSIEKPPVKTSGEGEHLFARRVMVVVVTGMAALLGVVLIYFTAQIITLLFASVLLAVILSAPADLLAERARMPRGAALGVVIAGVILFFSLFGLSLGQTVYAQVRELKRTLPGAILALEEDVKHAPWIQRFSAKKEPAATSAATVAATNAAAATGVAATEEGEEDAGNMLAGWISRGEEYAAQMLTSEEFYRTGWGALSATAGLIGAGILVLAIALFLAMDPETYVKGFVTLFPVSRRARVGRILHAAGGALQWWFLGQLCSMTVVGLLTWIGLVILGVPNGLTLAILAGLMTFIPNFGPIIAAIPAVLIALAPHGTGTEINGHLALYVVILYLLVQMADGWAITPFIQKRALHMPPAMIMIAQVTLLLLLGGMGLLLATPILAAITVMVRMLYVEDVLGDHSMPVKDGPLERKKKRG